MEKSFCDWLPEKHDEYSAAMAEYRNILNLKPTNDLSHLGQPLLAEQVHPLIFDLCRLVLEDRKSIPLHLIGTLKRSVAPPVFE